MFLRLPAVIAGGRALGALACVVASMSGHAALGHHHVDVPRAAFAFLFLLAASWRTHDVRWLLLAGQLSQAVVHGGAAAASLPMIVMHSLFGLAAALLVWRFEVLWAAGIALLSPLRRALALSTGTLPRPANRPRMLLHVPVTALLHRAAECSSGRAPPVPA